VLSPSDVSFSKPNVNICVLCDIEDFLISGKLCHSSPKTHFPGGTNSAFGMVLMGAKCCCTHRRGSVYRPWSADIWVKGVAWCEEGRQADGAYLNHTVADGNANYVGESPSQLQVSLDGCIAATNVGHWETQSGFVSNHAAGSDEFDYDMVDCGGQCSHYQLTGDGQCLWHLIAHLSCPE
jgi:hypothetical protein